MSEPRPTGPFKNRAPAWPVLLAFIAGILLDHFASDELELGGLLLFSCIASAIWLTLTRLYPRFALPALLLVIAGSGSVWHHLQWAVAPSDHILRYAQPEPAACELQLTLLDVPTVDRETLPDFATAWPDEPRSRFQAEVVGLKKQGQFVPCSGKLLVSVTGEMPSWKAGQTLTAQGMLRELTPPRNPGEYNFAEAMRRQQIYVSLFCESPEATQLQSRAASHTPVFGQTLNQLRYDILQVLQQTLPAEQAAVAAALLLGERDTLSATQQTSFRRSGLAHLLSISGLHVGLFGFALFATGRFLNLPPRSVAILTAAGMTACLLAAESRAPVLRAWILGMTLLGMSQLQRPISLIQGLAISGLVVLLINPTWLFDTGTHLSFLAVGTILILMTMKPLPGPWDSVDQEEQQTSWWREEAATAFRLSVGITVVLLPLFGHVFHRVALAGIPGTVLALPLLMAVMLMLGIHLLWSTLCLAIAAPSAVLLTGWPTAFLLSCLSDLAAWFSSVQLLNWFSRRPSAAILLLLYASAGLALYCRGRTRPLRPRWAIGWTAIVLLLFEMPLTGSIDQQELCECRLLSVGHGNACLIRGPNGECVLIDGGSMENGQRAARAISASLADMQADRLAAVVISHTDTDHLNAVPFLLEELPIGRILVNPAGLDPDHPGFREVAERASARNIPLVALQAGDTIPLGSKASLNVLQCPPHPKAGFGNDNADSIVLELIAAGRRMLIPGDVSGRGQQQLIDSVPGGFDAILVPHHGSKRDNDETFASWADPQLTLVSCGFDVDREFLETTYAHSQPFFTSTGAIRLTINERGAMQLSQWQPDQSWAVVRSSE